MSESKPLFELRRAQLAVALDEARDPIARRELLKLVGAAIGLAGLSACTRAPAGEIVPYVMQPPEVRPGRPQHYATALTLDGYATGVLVETHEGRPTKVEGNPDHPASLGASGIYEQASILSLYDPGRARGTRRRGAAIAWETLARELTQGSWTERQGRGLHVLLEPTTSPSAAELLTELRARWPAAAVHFHAPGTPRNVWEGARLAFGRALEPRFDLGAAEVIVALDSDFLCSGPANLRMARQFADGRRLVATSDAMNRLYAVEPLLTVTGAAADHRLPVRGQDVQAVAASLLDAVGGRDLTGPVPDALRGEGGAQARFVRAVAADLGAHRGRSLVVVGAAQPPVVHAIAHAINAALGNIGKTVWMAPSPILEAGEASHDLGPIAEALDAGEVDTLVVLGANVVYTAPADRRLAVGRARQSLYLGMYDDETARACTFTAAQAHPLECWGDARAFDGTVSITQPMIDPLFGGRSVLDVLTVLAGLPARATAAYDRVRARLGAPSEAAWRHALVRGVTDDAPLAVVDAPVKWGAIAEAMGRAVRSSRDELEIVFPLDGRVHDGSFAMNAWLLELPASLSKLTWTNAATLAAETAARLGVATGDEIELRVGERRVHAPVLVAPGQAEGTVGLALGWGREAPGGLAHRLGANAYALRTTRSLAMGSGVVVSATGKRIELPITQLERSLQGRDHEILQHASFGELRKERAERGHTAPPKRRPLTLYDVRPPSQEHQWAMAIDLTACTGCSACVIACQAENNVPTVGRDGVLMGRAMHWLRVDSYFTGDARDPQVHAQPMLCQHCEKAPCEYVCPVNATVHSPDGLNVMVYNRCVGTRFCSNNCPYKVRRFNWFDYHHGEPPVAQLAHNPDVTVRERGVMEKCSFCVQRIREDEIRSRTEKGPRPPLRTACQQACPTRAIVFGDKLDAGSEVARLHESERSFAALDDLGTVPRVRYLKRIKNENPELA